VRLGDTLAPLALLSVGLLLRFDVHHWQAKSLGLGLGYKLMICPALVVIVLRLVHASIDMTTNVSVIEAAMPPMTGAGTVAAQAKAKLDAALASTMIGIGIPSDYRRHWLGTGCSPSWLAD